MDKIKGRLEYLYPERHEEVYGKVMDLIDSWKGRIRTSYPWVDKEDVVLITYGDAIRREGEMPLKTLKTFLDRELEDAVSTVHILPMFPYTSDDGFSVSDFREINPEFGTWEDIERLGENYDLMFDAVINHASVSSRYFREFLKGTEGYRDFFIVADPDRDYSMVTRPRVLPLLTVFETWEGPKHIWTTFSEDQVDFNYKDPNVLLEILDILLLYAQKGARFIRFDAIGFAWKEENTTCMHLPQTHELVRLMREVLQTCAPGCTIITETNVPHKDNISYFGNGYDEAGLVYQFPLPPLTLHSYISGSAKALSDWAASLEATTEGTTYFNFLASHDGIGMRPAEGLLSPEQVDIMVDTVLKRGGQVGYRSMPDGTQVPYELNISYVDAVAGDETDPERLVQKFMGSQCVLASVMGMPAIYYHSLLGSRNAYEDYQSSGIKRRINREKLDLDLLEQEIQDRDSVRRKVLDRYREMLALRKRQEAFSPNSRQEVLFLDDRVFALLRGEEGGRVLVLINVSGEHVELETSYHGTELFSGSKWKGRMELEPYCYHWIRLEEDGHS
ncbi:MAG TPA: alpha-amylase family glycosyl hydrolase [Clostridiaceae bacterium]|nr:alpha-amylase family glycosyl hydrolase [Clostridiaceae bacterium]